jgi:hypothetical protein
MQSCEPYGHLSTSIQLNKLFFFKIIHHLEKLVYLIELKMFEGALNFLKFVPLEIIGEVCKQIKSLSLKPYQDGDPDYKLPRSI